MTYHDNIALAVAALPTVDRSATPQASSGADTGAAKWGAPFNFEHNHSVPTMVGAQVFELIAAQLLYIGTTLDALAARLTAGGL